VGNEEFEPGHFYECCTCNNQPDVNLPQNSCPKSSVTELDVLSVTQLKPPLHINFHGPTELLLVHGNFCTMVFLTEYLTKSLVQY